MPSPPAVSPDRPAAPSAAAPTWRRHDALVTLLALAVLLLWDASDLDLPLDRWFGNAGGFPWRHHWLSEGLLHNGGHWLAIAMVVGLAVRIWWPWGAARQLGRHDRVWWLTTTLACMALIPVIKHASLTSCPWDLKEFGGHAAWVSHWAWGVPDGGSGHCFPSGHATSAFGFFAGYFVLRHPAPSQARGWLATVLLLGLLYGAAQVVRGAHPLSHVLWTAWLCWVLSSLSHHLWERRTAARTPRPRARARTGNPGTRGSRPAAGSRAGRRSPRPRR